jgi:putative sterol carrier protein
MGSQSGPATHRADAVTGFFEMLAEQRQCPALHTESGTLRIDLVDGSEVEHWYVTLIKGDVSVGHSDADADTVIGAGRDLFGGMIDGTVNATAALLRGVLDVQGNLGLLASFARLFPGPPDSQSSIPQVHSGAAR